MPSNTEKKPKVIKQAELDIVCGVTSRLPDTGMPEVAFAGKSNVGKSSLINGLMNRKSLARTSGHSCALFQRGSPRAAALEAIMTVPGLPPLPENCRFRQILFP